MSVQLGVRLPHHEQQEGVLQHAAGESGVAFRWDRGAAEAEAKAAGGEENVAGGA